MFVYCFQQKYHLIHLLSRVFIVRLLSRWEYMIYLFFLQNVARLFTQQEKSGPLSWNTLDKKRRETFSSSEENLWPFWWACVKQWSSCHVTLSLSLIHARQNFSSCLEQSQNKNFLTGRICVIFTQPSLVHLYLSRQQKLNSKSM